MNKLLPVVFALSITAAPVLAWGEGGCSKKDKARQHETTEQVENTNASDK